MRRSSLVTLVIALIFLAVGGFWMLGSRGAPPPPETLIARSLQDAEDGARRRSVSQVMDVISEDFNSGGLNRDRLRLLVARSVRQGRGVNYDAHVNAPRILPSPKGDPDQRLVITKMSVFYTGTGEDIWKSEAMTLVMRKESRRRWLVFEEPYWRIVSVANLPPLPGISGDEGSLF